MCLRRICVVFPAAWRFPSTDTQRHRYSVAEASRWPARTFSVDILGDGYATAMVNHNVSNIRIGVRQRYKGQPQGQHYAAEPAGRYPWRYPSLCDFSVYKISWTDPYQCPQTEPPSYCQRFRRYVAATECLQDPVAGSTADPFRSFWGPKSRRKTTPTTISVFLRILKKKTDGSCH